MDYLTYATLFHLIQIIFSETGDSCQNGMVKNSETGKYLECLNNTWSEKTCPDNTTFSTDTKQCEGTVKLKAAKDPNKFPMDIRQTITDLLSGKYPSETTTTKKPTTVTVKTTTVTKTTTTTTTTTEKPTTAENELTWREILPQSCGYRGNKLKSILGLPLATGTNKVFHGVDSTIENNPWQAVIVNKAKRMSCGGTIISKYHVLTASHCFLKLENETINGVLIEKVEPVPYSKRFVLVGSTRYFESNLKFNISAIYIHSFYAPRHRRNDIALLHIIGEFTWSSSVYPICLPMETEAYTPGRECLISGYGADHQFLDSDEKPIQVGVVDISTDKHCKDNNERVFSHPISEGMFCAGRERRGGINVDTCQGDSGGPLSCPNRLNPEQSVLLGITSFGKGCAITNYPGVYTKVSKYLQWIYDRVEVSLGYGYGDRSELPEDVDIGRPQALYEFLQ